jgi:NAD(P)-dependent dehydrogenase (short-subunit alcohol dehydrogenase family)
MADLDLINATEIDFAAPYAISKGALNVAIAKYNALYKKEGILFLAVSPGYVTTERNQGMLMNNV